MFSSYGVCKDSSNIQIALCNFPFEIVSCSPLHFGETKTSYSSLWIQKVWDSVLSSFITPYFPLLILKTLQSFLPHSFVYLILRHRLHILCGLLYVYFLFSFSASNQWKPSSWQGTRWSLCPNWLSLPFSVQVWIFSFTDATPLPVWSSFWACLLLFSNSASTLWYEGSNYLSYALLYLQCWYIKEAQAITERILRCNLSQQIFHSIKVLK